jgi:hypothetical protein
MSRCVRGELEGVDATLGRALVIVWSVAQQCAAALATFGGLADKATTSKKLVTSLVFLSMYRI